MQSKSPNSNKEMLAVLAGTPAERLALPAAHFDVAFQKCMEEACSTPELIENFDRLTGCKVGRISSGSVLEKMVDQATGFQDDQMRQFVEFVHEYVYLLLPDEAIHAMRLANQIERL